MIARNEALRGLRPAPDEHTSLEDVVAAALRGSQFAWNSLTPLLLGTARTAAMETLGRSRDDADVEDIAAHAMRVAFERLGTLRDRRTVLAWVAAIARNCAINLATRRRDVAVDPADLDGLAPSGASPVDGIALADALRRLPPEQREALVLNVVDGFSFEEIGLIQGACKNTAASRARLARERLQELLGSDF